VLKLFPPGRPRLHATNAPSPGFGIGVPSVIVSSEGDRHDQPARSQAREHPAGTIVTFDKEVI
jgi:hypothetical protein